MKDGQGFARLLLTLFVSRYLIWLLGVPVRSQNFTNVWESLKPISHNTSRCLGGPE